MDLTPILNSFPVRIMDHLPFFIPSTVLIPIVLLFVISGLSAVPKLKRLKEYSAIREAQISITGIVKGGKFTNEGSHFTVEVLLPDRSTCLVSTEADAWKASQELTIGAAVRVLKHPHKKLYLFADYAPCRNTVGSLN